MTVEIAICLGILASALVLFAWDRIPAEVVALMVMLATIFTGILPTNTAFAGFGSDTVMLILGLLIMTAGLVHTGIVETVGRWIFSLAGKNETLFLPTITVAIGGISAFMSNTAATAFFVPLVMGYAARVGVSPSLYLLPIAFASILASSVTLMATSTNIVVSELLVKYDQPAIGVFELTPVGIPILMVGIAYLLIVGVRLIPQRSDQKPPETIGDRSYQAELVVVEDSPLVGKAVAESRLGESSGIRIVKLLRGELTYAGKRALDDTEFQAGDELIVVGNRGDLLRLRNLTGVTFKADVHPADADDASTAAVARGTAGQEAEDKEKEKEDEEELEVVEGVLMPLSPLIGQTLADLDFQERYGLKVLAIHRAGRVPQRLSDVELRLGDVLLLQGPKDNVRALERGNLFNIFGVEPHQLNVTKGWLAVAIFIAAIAAATISLVKLPVAVLAGATAMLLTRCLPPEEAYRQVEWKALVLIGALLSLGAAMESTGSGRYLADLLIGIAGRDQPHLLLASFFVGTVLLTQPMSNQAAAVVLLPVAIQTGLQIDANPRTFAMMVAVAASCSYLTPLEPACLMVYGPGRYKFFDFFKVGMPLTFVVFALAMLLVPLVWPL